MTGAGPPKCKTCGKSGWRHLCSGGGVVIAGVKLNEEGETAHAGTPRRRPAPVAKITVAAVLQPVRLEATPTGELLGVGAAPDGHGARARGRPKKGEAAVTDRKAYKAEKARERRARQKGVSDAKGEGST